MKYAWIEANREQYRVARMCRQLEVSRTGYCQWSKRAPSERSAANAALDVHVAAIHRVGDDPPLTARQHNLNRSVRFSISAAR